ncbi:MAG: hypothetical protein M0024_10460 [Nitrospiraceae bacterium]|nr:hypothetical protein [Nitrospiraceae bacterium]
MTKPLAMQKGALDIIAPLISVNEPFTNPLEVTYKSAKQHRKAVYKIARFFKKEFQYDFVQYGYDGDEKDELHCAFLWIDPGTVELATEFRVPCVGATCFRWRSNADDSPLWVMDWIWIHPFYRRKGLLTAAWPQFRDRFKDFVCERPLSEAMKKFLLKNDG